MSVAKSLSSIAIDQGTALCELNNVKDRLVKLDHRVSKLQGMKPREWWHDQLPKDAAWKMRRAKLDLWDVPGIKNTKRYGMTKDEVRQFMTNLTRETAYEFWEDSVVVEGEPEKDPGWYWDKAERSLFTDGS